MTADEPSHFPISNQRTPSHGLATLLCSPVSTPVLIQSERAVPSPPVPCHPLLFPVLPLYPCPSPQLLSVPLPAHSTNPIYPAAERRPVGAIKCHDPAENTPPAADTVSWSPSCSGLLVRPLPLYPGPLAAPVSWSPSCSGLLVRPLPLYPGPLAAPVSWSPSCSGLLVRPLPLYPGPLAAPVSWSPSCSGLLVRPLPLYPGPLAAPVSWSPQLLRSPGPTAATVSWSPGCSGLLVPQLLRSPGPTADTVSWSPSCSGPLVRLRPRSFGFVALPPSPGPFVVLVPWCVRFVFSVLRLPVGMYMSLIPEFASPLPVLLILCLLALFCPRPVRSSCSLVSLIPWSPSPPVPWSAGPRALRSSGPWFPW